MSPLLSLEQVSRSFVQRRGKRAVRAVDAVSLEVAPGETLGLVGESGCGKSTLARLALRLLEPEEGRIRFDGLDITHAPPRALLPVRRRMQAVFQDPLASLNPRMTVAEILREPFATHRIRPPGGAAARIAELLAVVGLEGVDPARRPQQFSGGQLQRIAIARALALEPSLIVADEPTSALDPSIQAQIVNLLLRIQRERGISYLVISHDLDVVGHIADRIAVMYLGAIVESGPAAAIMAEPLHPYSQALLSAAPTLTARRDRSWRRIMLAGDLPNPADKPAGCRFHPRCALARDICRREAPPLRPPDAAGRLVACHLAPAETRARGAEIGRARTGRATPPEFHRADTQQQRERT
ncbi:MAG: oligopeptide/dipeptide ABC transporter ATP-binding protein [Dongiaceae bacterium]